jgi:hypothetical protein
MILAIDPGPKVSGIVTYCNGIVTSAAVMSNNDALFEVMNIAADYFAYEMIASYGARVGAETFQTCVWIGRVMQAWEFRLIKDECSSIPVYRMDVKKHLLHSHQGSDKDVKAALVAMFGEVGTKKRQGPLFGVKSHAWAALGVAVTAQDMIDNPAVWKRAGNE